MTRSVQTIVEEQYNTWRYRQKHHHAALAPTSGAQQQPAITIAREYGSEGDEIAIAVARRLEIAHFSQELVHQIAIRAHVQDGSVAAMDEHRSEHLEVFVRELMDGKSFAIDDYRRHLVGTLKRLASLQSAVFVGRGGHHVLNAERTLRVRIVAPLEQRIQAVMRDEGLEYGMARRESAMWTRTAPDFISSTSKQTRRTRPVTI